MFGGMNPDHNFRAKRIEHKKTFIYVSRIVNSPFKKVFA